MQKINKALLNIFSVKNVTFEQSYLFFLGTMGEELIKNWAALSPN
jgi:hypothetical protein